MIIVGYLPDLFLGTENVDNMFLRNVCQPQDYTISHYTK
jgi:hypothetical protein